MHPTSHESYRNRGRRTRNHFYRKLKPPLQLIPAVLSVLFVVWSGQVAAAQQTFQHPGVMVGKAQLDFIKAQVNAHIEPMFSAYQNAIANPYGSLTPADNAGGTFAGGPAPQGPPAGGTIDCGSSSNPDTGCTADDEDGAVAYVQALLWWITGNQTYANNAIAILNAYGHNLKSFTNSNGPLQAAWSGSKWPRAAEIIRYSNAGWAPADATAFGTMLNNAIVPQIFNGSTNNANWELSMIEAMVGIAVYNNDQSLYTHATGMWSNDVPKFVQTTGQNAETCRDMGHALFELSAILNAAETAHIQGGTLYESQQQRLAATLEFHTGLLLGRPEPVSGCSSVTLTPDRPTFALGYNEFHNRLGMTLTNTHDWLPTVFANQVTSPGAWPGTPVDHHMVVYETLTHGADAGTSSFMVSATPASQSVTAGGHVSYAVSVSPVGAFAGAVALSVSGLPSGATATFSAASIAGGSGSSTLTVTTGSSTPAGTYTLTITGTSGSTTNSATVNLGVNVQPDFSLTATPTSQAVNPGGGASFTVHVGALNGFAGSVALSVSGAPSGATATLSPTSINTSGSSSLSVTTSSATPSGSYTLTITGVSGNPSLTHSVTVNLMVQPPPPPDFSLTATPSSQMVMPGSATSYVATVTPIGSFGGTVAFSVSGLPSGASGSFSPISINGSSESSTLSVSTANTTPSGSYNLTITAASGSLSHSATVTLVVQNSCQTVGSTWQNAAIGDQTGIFTVTFDATPSASPINAVVGLSPVAAAAYTDLAAIARFNPSGDIDARKTGAYAADNTIPYSGGVKYHFRMVVNIPAHTYSTFVTGPDGTEKTVGANFAFRSEQATASTLSWWGAFSEVGSDNFCNFMLPPNADFSLAATPSSQTVVAGNATSYTTTIGSIGGFNGAVALSVSGMPSGASATFSPSSLSGGSGSSTLNVTTSHTTPPGSYTLTITGASGGLSHTATVALTVNTPSPADFNVSLTPASQTVMPGSGTTYSVAVAPIQGFNGAVGLSLSGLPSDATGTFSPASIAGSGSSTLSISTSGATPPGSYTLTVTATSGSISHSATTTLVVQNSCQTVGSTWQNAAIASQTGSFTVVFDATPSASPINAVVGLSPVAAAAYTDLATIARFNPSGDIDARNGGAYAADNTIPYSGGVTYHFRMVIDIPAHTYSTFVTAPGGTEQTVGANFAFRSEQATVSSLSWWGAFSEVGSDNFCSFMLPANNDFTLGVTPNSQSLTAGGSTTFTVNVTPIGGYGGTVALSATGLPSGAKASFNPASIGGGSGSSTLTVTAGTATPSGTSNITITGADSGAMLTHSASVALNVQNTSADFNLSVSPASQTVTQGSSVTLTASVNPLNGYSKTVSLRVTGLPSGATASFSPASISNGSGSSTLTITTNGTTMTGPTTITITGADGVLTHTASASLTVNPSTACAHGNGPLNPNVPPGCNFDLSIWSLQLPIGQPGNPTTLTNTQLENGFTDPFFFTGSDGSMDFFDPGTNCVTTANSTHCRSELRELNPDGTDAVWSSSGTNTLSATLTVTNAAGAPVVGQIHLDPAVSVRPLIELFYTTSGDLVAGVEQCTAGGCETRTTVGHVAPGTQFTYVISYTHNVLTVSIDGGTPHSLSSPLLGDGGYFKAGDYGQSPTNASVSFTKLVVVHGP